MSCFLGIDPTTGDPIHIPPERLRTHGVVVGMTGSGKTGFSLVMLEELVRAGVPVIAIDPKGDLGNLGLLFPEFQAEDFAPWCGQDDDPAEVAQRWQMGLLKSKITAPQVAELKQKMALTVYTPGSQAGVPVNLLGMLAPPEPELLADAEARQELLSGTAAGLLGLTGQKFDPVQDPAPVVIAQILDQAWEAGEQLDLATLVLRIVDPPFEKLGVFPLDSFFPPAARMKLAMAFNALLVSPSFQAWSQGAALDPAQLLKAGDRTPVSVFSIAHLDQSQREFFVALLSASLLAWSRRQPGSQDLRALLFFDEVAGYLPPHPHNPPTKAPILTMMKQARAVGLGVLLATQNPVDLDYKALSNAGLWAIGRLNTAQDRERLLKGIEGQAHDKTVAGLDKRQFFLHQTGRDPVVLSSRHAICYLRGPLTRVEIGALNTLLGVQADAPAAAPEAAPAAPEETEGLSLAPPVVPGVPARYLSPEVAFAARMEGAFSEHALDKRADGKQEYAPALLAELTLRFDEDRVGFILDQELARVFFPLSADLDAEPLPVRLSPSDIEEAPVPGAYFQPLPAELDEKKEWAAFKKRFVDEVYRTERAGMFVNKKLKLYGRAGESEEEFTARCQEAIDARVDEGLVKLKERFQKKLDRLEDRIAAKEGKLEELRGVARSRQLEEAAGIGATLLSFFGGRSRRLSSVATRRRQTAQAGARVEQAEAEIERLSADAEALQAELLEAEANLQDKEDKALAQIEERQVRLEKADIRVDSFGLLWVPIRRRV